MIQYFRNSLLLGLALEGRLRGEEDIKNDSAAPDVALIGEIALYDLRGKITDRAHQIFTPDFGPGHFKSSAEVKQLQINLFAAGIVFNLLDKHHVLQLDVPMHDA